MFFAFLLVITIGFIFTNQLIQSRNLTVAKSLLACLRQQYVGLYGIQSSESVSCIRIDDVDLRVPPGRSSPLLAVSCSVIEPDGRYKITPGHWYILSLDWAPLSRNSVSVLSFASELGRFCQARSVNFFGPDSLDADVCAILFQNSPEFRWALGSIAELEVALESAEKAYSASLANELLAGNRVQFSKAVNLLNAEINALRLYALESKGAMRKAYEYLSLPNALKSFNSADIDPLRIYAKGASMRSAFESAVKVKYEYDLLRETSAGMR
jgi:hypothetical protein